MTEDTRINYKVNTLHDCETMKVGMMRITQTLSLGETLSLQSVLECQEEVKYEVDDSTDDFAYKIIKRNMDYKYFQTNKIEDPNMGYTATINGSGSLSETFGSMDEKPVRFVIGRDNSVTFSSGYDSEKNSEWVNFIKDITSAGITYTDTEKGTPIFNLMDNLYNFKLEKSEIFPDKIKGTRSTQYTDSMGGILTTKLEFEYEIPK